MAHHIVLSISLVFVALSVCFVALVLKETLTEKENMTSSKTIRLRVAIIFSVVGAGLSFLNVFL